MTGNFCKILDKFCKFITIKKEKFHKILKTLRRNIMEFRRTFSTILEMTRIKIFSKILKENFPQNSSMFYEIFTQHQFNNIPNFPKNFIKFLF